VRDSDAAQAVRRGNGIKELIAQAPGSIFEIPTVAARLASYIGPVRHKIKLKLPCKAGNEHFVRVRIGAPKLMVEMQNEKPDTELRTQPGQQAQKRD
jgi:hypothetical protein